MRLFAVTIAVASRRRKMRHGNVGGGTKIRKLGRGKIYLLVSRKISALSRLNTQINVLMFMPKMVKNSPKSTFNCKIFFRGYTTLKRKGPDGEEGESREEGGCVMAVGRWTPLHACDC